MASFRDINDWVYSVDELYEMHNMLDLKMGLESQAQDYGKDNH